MLLRVVEPVLPSRALPAGVSVSAVRRGVPSLALLEEPGVDPKMSLVAGVIDPASRFRAAPCNVGTATPCLAESDLEAFLAILCASSSRRGVAGILKGPSFGGGRGSSESLERRAIGVEASVPIVISFLRALGPSEAAVGSGKASTKE
jgi:hypothetical protein